MKVGLREIIFILLLMAIPIGSWWFVFRPHNAREAQMLAEIEAKQEKLRALNRATATIGDLRKEIRALEKALAFFRDKLPSEKEIDKVLKEVWLLAESNNLITKSIRTRQQNSSNSFATKFGAHSEQPIAMQLEGDYLGLYAFLQALENQPRIMRVCSMKLRKPKKGAPGSVQADFEMSIFFDKNHKAKL